MKETSSTPHELNALHLPDAPTWWPLAWGWWAGAASIVLVVVIIMLVIRWKRKRMAPKKTALRLLNPHLKQTPSSAIELLRQAALCYFPREEIAHLTGNAWYTFLDTQVGRPLFVPNETVWQQALYQKQKIADADALVADCYQWVNDALPPKKRRPVSVGKH